MDSWTLVEDAKNELVEESIAKEKKQNDTSGHSFHNFHFMNEMIVSHV